MKPSFSFKILQKTEKYIKENKLIGHGDCVLVGLSGGADSVCLFLLLNELKNILEFDICCVHVNHGIRGKSADDDELFSKNLCDINNVPFKSITIDVPAIAKEKGLSMEEAGRIERYNCFETFAKAIIDSGKSSTVKIAVAHHMNDQSETVLFNMVRGSGLKGIGGMSPENKWTENISVVRPLLCMTRSEIEKYLASINQAFRIDETNTDNDYSRNQIRNEVIPELDKIQPKTGEHISLLAEEVREVIEYMESEVEKLFTNATEKISDDEEMLKYGNGYKLKVSILKDKRPIIVRNLIIYVLKELIDNYKDITRIHIEDIYSLLNKGKGKYITLPYGIIAKKEKEYIIIYKS